MATNTPDAMLAQLSERLAARIGLQFAPERWSDLERGVAFAARDLGFADLAPCMRWLLSSELSRTEIEILASHLTVGETYFFREPRSFDRLRDALLPQLIRSRREANRYLRLWSAACSTGEEAFSLAMLLDMLIPDIGDWNITVLATDINPRFLQRAAAAVYGEWSFRGVAPEIRARYFTAAESGGLEVIPRIRKMVTFAYHNLIEDPYPTLRGATNAMDIVLCRNVLMYFSPNGATRAIDHLHRALIDGGWLIPGSVEAHPSQFAPFVLVSTEAATFYRKVDRPPEQPSAFAAPPPATTPSHPMIDASEPPASPANEAECVDPAVLTFESAVALYDQGRYGEAAAALSAHLVTRPDDGSAMLLLARTLANQGLLVEAQQWCTKAIACDRLAPGSHYLLAIIRQERGDLAAAAAALKRALFLDPHFVSAHFSLANLARLQGKHREAAQHYRNTEALLAGRPYEDIVPESEGMTVGRLLEIVQHAERSDRPGEN